MTLVSMLALPFLACTMLAGILGYLGLHVLKREVIFIDIAVAQIAALGAIIAHLFLHIHGDSPMALVYAIGATIIAALFFSVARHKITHLPIEATIGITYAIAAAGMLFLIGKSATGHTHVQEMLTGALLWVSPRELLLSSVVFALAGIAFFLLRHPFQRISDRHGESINGGSSVIFWDFLFYVLCGIVITIAVWLAGVVVVFCFLIIPATISALFSERWGMRLLASWLAGSTASLVGLLFAYYLDFSAGVSVALFLGIALVTAGSITAIRSRQRRSITP